jgi:hypothetical protein
MLRKIGQHQVNRCSCGRTIHWPHTADIGDKWVCGNRNCRKTWTLVPPGTPGASSGIMVPSWGHCNPAAPARRTAATRRRPTPGRSHRPEQPQGLLGQLAAFFGLHFS